MSELEPYSAAKGVEDAIKAAARRAATSDPSLTIGERIRLEHFNRFLSRIFSEGPNSDWLLKGGTGMLARVPSTRATVDIDLYCEGYRIDDAVADLRRLADHDLGDHFRFIYVGHRAIVGGDSQPNTDGYRVDFDTYIGVQKKGRIGVDLTTGTSLTAEPTVTAPASALVLPRLARFDYRLYPVVDQIADKVCATMHHYGDRASSREKDLLDLVVRAVTHDVDGAALSTAIATEARQRRMVPWSGLSSPLAGAPPTRRRLERSHTAAASRPSMRPSASSRRSSILRSMEPLPAGGGGLTRRHGGSNGGGSSSTSFV